jgi:hypothetical protein
VVEDLFGITASFRRPWHAPSPNAEVGVTRFQSVIVFDVPQKKKDYIYLPKKVQSYLLSRTGYLFGTSDENNDE